MLEDRADNYVDDITAVPAFDGQAVTVDDLDGYVVVDVADAPAVLTPGRALELAAAIADAAGRADRGGGE